MKNRIWMILILLLITEVSFSQKFNKSYKEFSRSKISYVELENGQIIKGFLNGFDKKNGTYKTVKLKLENKEKKTIDANEIKKMYLYPSGYSQLQSSLLTNDDLSKFKYDSKIDTSLIKKGYVYFEGMLTKIDKKDEIVLLQLLNPHFCDNISVYENPFSESSLISISDITIVKGSRSYYIHKKTEPKAYKLYSYDYSKFFSYLFGDSKEFMKNYGKEIIWLNFEKDISNYSLTKVHK